MKKNNKKNILMRLNNVCSELVNRKKNDFLSYYNTGKVVHLKQLEFHKCTAKNRWVFGGNRSGKTECGAVETVWLARGIHPYKQNKKNVSCWVVSLSTQVQRDVAQSKVLHYLKKEWIEEIVMLQGKKGSPELGIIDYITIKNVFGGTSRIGFKSCDQGREKFQGTSLDFVWFDEEPPYDIYLECKMRVIDKCGEIFGTMTPLKGLTWVYNEIYLNKFKDKNVWHIHMNWYDNPYLNKTEIEDLEHSLSKEELDARCYGLFSANGGVVYTEFDENVNVIKPFNVPLEWYDKISVDPGLNNPLSAHWYACDYDGNVYVIAEHFEAHKDIEYHANKIISICKRLNWPSGFGGKYEILIDSAANQKTLASTKSVTELFYDYGIYANPNVNKNLFAGINRVKSYLKNAKGVTKLFIFNTCVNLIEEIKTYYWGENDVPVKKDDHALDELRYYIMSKPEFAKVEEVKTIIQKDKEKRIRKLKYSKKYI